MSSLKLMKSFLKTLVFLRDCGIKATKVYYPALVMYFGTCHVYFIRCIHKTTMSDNPLTIIADVEFVVSTRIHSS